MNPLDKLIAQFPPDVQNTIRQVWENLNPDERNNLLALATSLPGKSDLMKILVKSSTAQVRQTFGQKHSVAIVGPANVGKSTLYNHFIASKKDRANVSPIPGTTQENQAAASALFTIVDTPGADTVGEKGQRERSHAFAAASYADFLVLVFDAVQGIKRGEQELFNQMLALGKPFIVVLNKIDLIPGKEIEKVIALSAANLGLEPGQLVAISARDGRHLDRVLLAIVSAEPRLIVALGRALPEYRWQLAWRSIINAASVSGAIALTPLPVIDFIPLVATQSVMVMGIARIYDYDITPKRAAELIATFGLGFLGKTLFQQLSKLGSVPGWLLSAAIASSTTVAMGYAAVHWFDKGERLSADAMKRITHSVTDRQLKALKGLGRSKPASQGVKEKIAETLKSSNIGNDMNVTLIPDNNQSEKPQNTQKTQKGNKPK